MCQQFLSVESAQVCLLNSGIFDSLPSLSNGVSPTSQTQHFQTQTASFIVPISFNKKFHLSHFSGQILESNAWLPFSYLIFVRKSYWLTTFCPMYGPSHHPCYLVDCNILLAGLYFHLCFLQSTVHARAEGSCENAQILSPHGSHLTQRKGPWLLRFIKP